MRLDDGFSTTVTFSEAPTVKFWEKTVTPVGFSGGGPNETTTMRNVAWRTNAPKKLKSLTQMSMTAAYDPQVLEDIEAMALVNQLITITFPDFSTWEFYGWLDMFEPGEITEGEQPTADVTIEASNQDENGEEIAPVYTAYSP